jgi:hypothetical protein
MQAADWMEAVEDPIAQDLGLDPGETAAILLAEKVRADALLIDERRGRLVAAARGISVWHRAQRSRAAQLAQFVFEIGNLR